MPKLHADNVIWWLAVLLGAAGLLLGVAALPVGALMNTLRDAIEGLGAWGPALYVGAFVVAGLTFLPVSLLLVAAGMVYGVAGGVPLAMLAGLVNVAVAVVGVRWLAGERLAEAMRRHPKFAAVEGAVRERGWRIVVLLRLVGFIPFAAQNYLLGLTTISLRGVLLGSAIGMLPSFVLIVYLGHAGKLGLEAMAGGGTAWWQWAAMGVGLVAAATVAVYVARVAKRALAQYVPEQAAAEAERLEHGGTPRAPRRVRTAVAVVVGLAVLGGGVWAQLNRETVQSTVTRWVE